MKAGSQLRQITGRSLAGLLRNCHINDRKQKRTYYYREVKQALDGSWFCVYDKDAANILKETEMIVNGKEVVNDNL